MINTKPLLYSVQLAPPATTTETKVLLILHGFMGMSDNWKTLGTQFAANGFQVHLLDLRNHGRSFHADEFNYEVMMQDVLDYCEAHQLEQVSVIGHSMGGKVGMLLATTHPELVNKLVVVDIGPKYYRPHHQDILAGLNAVDFSVKPSRSEVEEILKQYIDDYGTIQFLTKSLYWITPGQLAFRFNLPVFNSKTDQIGNALPETALFEKPTLFVRGGNSSYIREKDYAGIQHHFPKATIETISNTGHWLHAENPKAFYELTDSFLNESV